MSGKRMFIIPEELMEKIEKHRGEMSRSEFVDYCVDCILKGRVPPQETPPREGQHDSSLDQLKRQVIRTLEGRPLLNSSALVEVPTQAVPVSGQPAASVAAAKPAVEPVRLEVEEKRESKLGSMPFSWLWVPALLLFGFGDTLTSHLVFANGGQEANPFMATVMQFAGGGMMGFVAIKAVIMVALVLLSWFWLKKHGWIVPAALSIVGGYLVGHNIITLMGLM